MIAYIEGCCYPPDIQSYYFNSCLFDVAETYIKYIKDDIFLQWTKSTWNYNINDKK